MTEMADLLWSSHRILQKGRATGGIAGSVSTVHRLKKAGRSISAKKILGQA